jgi:sortase A
MVKKRPALMGSYAYLVHHPGRREEEKDRSQGGGKQVPASKIERSRKLPFLLILAGLGLLGTAGWPVVQWQLIQAYDVAEGTLVKPVVDVSAEKETSAPARPSQFGQLLLPPDLGTLEKPPAPLGGFDKRMYINEYYLTVPKLGIERAVVKVDSDTFDKSLAAYPGSALPNEEGNVFISGHSVLPKFYNPTDYKTIFSTIHTLEEGDEILLELGGVEYRYVVRSKRVVDPKDISVIRPPATGKFVTLMTCNPPGTTLKRLVVLGELT